MRISKKQTIVRLQVFYTFILLMLLSFFCIGKCYGLHLSKNVITAPSSPPYTLEKAPGESDSQQSNTDHVQYNPHDSTPEGYLHVDGDNEARGANHDGSYCDNRHVNHCLNGPENAPSIIPDNAQISDLMPIVREEDVYMSDIYTNDYTVRENMQAISEAYTAWLNIDTPEGVEGNIFSMDHNIAYQASDYNVNPTIYTVAGLYSIVWVSIICSIFFLMGDFFKITKKLCNRLSSKFSLFRFANPSTPPY